MGFEVGKLLARIQVEGMATFSRDLQQAGKEFTKLDDQGRQASTQIGRSLSAVGVSILALVALAVARFAEFDRAMSESGAVVDGFAEKQYELRDAALEAGAETIYTATEAAKAQAELGKAGIAASEILSGALTGSLALAAAGQLEVADAASIAATAMTQFKLSGEDVPHIADLLAAGANKAQGGVTDLSYALKQSGLVASQMGLSLEDTVGTLSAFASAGLIGSDAGTSFRTMLLNLATPTKQQTALMEKYNISAYDQATGTFIGIEALAGKLKAAKFATQAERDYALGVIFGSDAIRAANVLYDQGAEGIAKWTDEVNDAGAAARIAGQLQDNLAGDVEKLGGALDSALIRTGEGANGVLRDLVQWLTSLVDIYNELDPAVQQFVLMGGVAIGIITLLAGAFFMAVPKIVEFRLALQELNRQVPALGKTMSGLMGLLGGPWGIALAVAGIAVVGFMEKQARADEQAKAYAASLDQATGALSDQSRELAKAALSTNDAWNAWLVGGESAYDAAEKLGISLTDVTDAALGNEDALARVRKELGLNADGSTDLAQQQELLARLQSEYGLSAQDVTTSIGILTGAIQEQNDALNRGKDITEQKSDADEKNTETTYASADAYLAANQEASGLADTLTQLLETLNDANESNQDAISANIDYQNTLADVDEAIHAAQEGQEGYSLTLDQSTQAGRDNMEMLIGLADEGWNAAEAGLAAGDSAETFQAKLQASRDDLVKRAMDLGYTAEQAHELADRILAIPTKREIDVIADTQQAATALDTLLGKINEVRNTQLAVRTTGGPLMQADGGHVKFFASGGENHVAQYARAGDWRVWAEPETRGEWYFPEATKDVGLAQKMLAGWGYDIVPRGGAGVAVAPAQAGGGVGDVNVYIGSEKLRVIAREEAEGAITNVAVEYEGGTNP